MYTARTANGDMYCKINQQILDNLIAKFYGVKKVKKFTSGKSVVCFIFKEDCSLSREGLKLFFFEDSYVELYEV